VLSHAPPQIQQATDFGVIWDYINSIPQETLNRRCICGRNVQIRKTLEVSGDVIFFDIGMDAGEFQNTLSFPGVIRKDDALFQLIGRIYCTIRKGGHYFCRYLLLPPVDDYGRQDHPVVVHYDSALNGGTPVVLGDYDQRPSLLEGVHFQTTHVVYMKMPHSRVFHWQSIAADSVVGGSSRLGVSMFMFSSSSSHLPLDFFL
jgi:hypothetical protein